MELMELLILVMMLLEYIIENYTSEPGVRKLKEILFEIVGN
jgi:ATP-dependent Lon protease